MFVLVLAGGCQPSDDGATVTAEAEQAAAPVQPENPEPEAGGDEAPSPSDFRPAGTEPPRTRAFEPTEDEQVGTLPEGVGVPVGSPAPDAAVEDINGDTVTLAEQYAMGPTLLVFYRGGWCPYCNFQIHDLAGAAEDFASRGVTPVAISVDRVEEAYRTDAAFEIPFPVLSDPDLVAHEAYNVVHEASDEEVERLTGFGLDIEAYSGREHHSFAIPSVFLVGEDGVVRWAHADTDYKVRPTIAHLLAAIDASLGAE